MTSLLAHCHFDNESGALEIIVFKHIFMSDMHIKFDGDAHKGFVFILFISSSEIQMHAPTEQHQPNHIPSAMHKTSKCFKT